jgi:Cu(I)/Ag(I) efflux system membrane protein CusA/SilA
MPCGKSRAIPQQTDNSPISMIETTLLKPQNEWREGTTKSDIITEINNKLQIWSDKWVYATYY